VQRKQGLLVGSCSHNRFGLQGLVTRTVMYR